MNKSKTKKSFSYRDLLYKALIFIGTVAIIVYFLPRDGKFNYQFDIDKPWKYGQLMATFNFPIYKDDAVVKHEQDSILASFQPYYQLDKNVEKTVLSKLKTDYQSHLRDIVPSSDYMRYLEKRLSEIYKAGILSTEERSKLQKDSTAVIMVIDDKLANQRGTEQLFSVKDAYAYLLTADTTHYSPYILRQCSLNEYLYPNLTYDEQRTETAKKEALDNYAWANGVVQSGQKIIDRGEIVDKETYNILESLRKESIQRSESIGQKRLILTGQILFVSIFMLCFMLYLDLFRKDYYERKGSLSLLFTLIMFYCVVTALMVSNNIYNVYIIPRFTHSIPYAGGHYTDLLHLPTLPTRIYITATGCRSGRYFQFARIVTTFATLPYGIISDTDLCCSLLRFRTDHRKRFIEIKRKYV